MDSLDGGANGRGRAGGLPGTRLQRLARASSVAGGLSLLAPDPEAVRALLGLEPELLLEVLHRSPGSVLDAERLALRVPVEDLDEQAMGAVQRLVEGLDGREE